MTQERVQAERETIAAIESIWQGGNEALLRAAALSYAKGLRDGAQIMERRREEPTAHMPVQCNYAFL